MTQRHVQDLRLVLDDQQDVQHRRHLHDPCDRRYLAQQRQLHRGRDCLGSTTSNNGLFRVTQGTYNIGIGAGDQMRGGTGAVFTIEGGTINVSGAFDPQNAVTYTQSAGTLNVGVVGNNVSNFGTFELFSTASPELST